MEEDYSGEVGKPWNNRYWEGDRLRMEPILEMNFVGEGWLSFPFQGREGVDKFLKRCKGDRIASPKGFKSIREVVIGDYCQSSLESPFIVFCLERKALFSDN